MIKRNENLSKTLNSTQNKVFIGNGNGTAVILDKENELDEEEMPVIKDSRSTRDKGPKESQSTKDEILTYEESVDMTEVTEKKTTELSKTNVDIFDDEDEDDDDEDIDVAVTKQFISRLDNLRSELQDQYNLPPYDIIDDINTESYDVILDSTEDGSASMFTFRRSPQFPGML